MPYRDQRLPTDLGIRVAHCDELYSARLVNVSTTGARLDLPGRCLPQDALVTLHRLDCRIPARVVWSNGRQTAVHFVTPLSQSSMNFLRGVGGQTSSFWGVKSGGFTELT